MSGSSADLDGAISRLNKAMGALEARVRDLKARADSPRPSSDDDGLFAERRQDSGRNEALEAAAREASKALDQAASEIRAVLGEA